MSFHNSPFTKCPIGILIFDKLLRTRKPFPLHKDIAANLDKIEEYLINHGFRSIIPYERRRRFELRQSMLWTATLALVACLTLILEGMHISGVVLFAIGAPLWCLLLWGALRFLAGKSLLIPRNYIGQLFVVVSMVTIAIAAGYLTQLPTTTIIFLGMASLCLLTLQLLPGIKSDLFVLNNSIVLLKRSFFLVFRVMFMLLPMMIILLVFSIFSSELWLAIGALSNLRFMLGIALILILGVLVFVGRLKSVVVELSDHPKDTDFNSLSPVWEEHTSTALSEGLIQWINRQGNRRVEGDWWELVDKYWCSGLRTNVVVTLVSSGLLLSVFLFSYLFVFFMVLLPPSVVEAFQLELFNQQPSISILRVSLFLTVFVFSYFCFIAFTDEKIRAEVFAPLSALSAEWRQLLGLYYLSVYPNVVISSNIVSPEIPLQVREVLVPEMEIGKNEFERIRFHLEAKKVNVFIIHAQYQHLAKQDPYHSIKNVRCLIYWQGLDHLLELDTVPADARRWYERVNDNNYREHEFLGNTFFTKEMAKEMYGSPGRQRDYFLYCHRPTNAEIIQVFIIFQTDCQLNLLESLSKEIHQSTISEQWLRPVIIATVLEREPTCAIRAIRIMSDNNSALIESPGFSERVLDQNSSPTSI